MKELTLEMLEEWEKKRIEKLVLEHAIENTNKHAEEMINALNSLTRNLRGDEERFPEKKEWTM